MDTFSLDQEVFTCRDIGRPKRVARLMREAALAGISRRRGPVTTRGDREARPAPDLVDRNFTADAPDRLRVADITFVPTLAGFLYLAVVWMAGAAGSWAGQWRTTSGRCSCSTPSKCRSANASRRTSCITPSRAANIRCSPSAAAVEAGVRPSVGSVGDAYDNAMCESFFATLECELLARRRFASQSEARMALFSYIEGWYNPGRRHSALGYLSPNRLRDEDAIRELRPKPVTVHGNGSTPPVATGIGAPVQVRIQREQLGRLNSCIAGLPDPKPSRP